MSQDKAYLNEIRQKCEAFLTEKLNLSLHPAKVSITTIYSGIDFLGWVHFPHHRVLRTATKKRMFRNVNEKNLSSYLGLLGHGNGYGLQKHLKIMTLKDSDDVLPVENYPVLEDGQGTVYWWVMSKESFVFVLGALVFFSPYLGIPSEYKEWVSIVCGVLLMMLGYRLRRSAFLKSLEHESGERRSDAFVEGGIRAGDRAPVHKDSLQIE